MPIHLTSGDTFDGIDIEITKGDAVLGNAEVASAVARIKKSDGTVQERTLSIGPEAGRFRYRMVAGDYAHFPGPGTYSYQVKLTMSDSTVKFVPSIGVKRMKVAAQL